MSICPVHCPVEESLDSSIVRRCMCRVTFKQKLLAQDLNKRGSKWGNTLIGGNNMSSRRWRSEPNSNSNN